MTPRSGLVAAVLAGVENFVFEPAAPGRDAPPQAGSARSTAGPVPDSPVAARSTAAPVPDSQVAARLTAGPVSDSPVAYAPRPPDAPAPGPVPAARRPVIAVFGLGRRCGATVVARALAAELAARDPSGAAAVASGRPAGAIPLATSAAGRLAGSLADVPGATATAVGRICLVEGADHVALADTARHFAPLVLDAGTTPVGGAASSAADRALLVATSSTEPALAAVTAACLEAGGATAVAVVNCARGAHWRGPAAIELPHSRMGAQLALAGRQPRGDLGAAIARVADACEAAA